jgi:hypothetical protein
VQTKLSSHKHILINQRGYGDTVGLPYQPKGDNCRQLIKATTKFNKSSQQSSLKAKLKISKKHKIKIENKNKPNSLQLKAQDQLGSI